jgi:hypothetical protein
MDEELDYWKDKYDELKSSILKKLEGTDLELKEAIKQLRK